MRFFVFAFVNKGIAERALHLRQLVFGFLERKVARHLSTRPAQARGEAQRRHAQTQNRAAEHSIKDCRVSLAPGLCRRRRRPIVRIRFGGSGGPGRLRDVLPAGEQRRQIVAGRLGVRVAEIEPINTTRYYRKLNAADDAIEMYLFDGKWLVVAIIDSEAQVASPR